MIQVKGNVEGSTVDITGEMTIAEMLTEAVGAILAIVGAVASEEGEGIARGFAEAVVNVLSNEEAVDEAIKQGLEAVKQ